MNSSQRSRLAIQEATAAAILLLGFACVLVGDEQANESVSQRASHLARMKDIAASLRVYPTPDRQTTVELVPEPVLRYTDNTRQLHESSLWIWGKSGRPNAIVAIEFYTKGPRGPRWLYEVASLSTERIAIERGKDLSWTANEPGLLLQPVAGGEPADRPTRRLAQMKELLRRFTAHEHAPVGGRIELRPLTNPLFRYEAASAELIDGAIFSFANGTNPEVLLVFEAHRQKDRPAVWQFGLVQMTGAEVTVELDGKKIWNCREADPPATRASYTNGWIPDGAGLSVTP